MIERYVQLLGDDLSQRRADAGAQIDLAGIKRHAAARIDRQEGIHIVKCDGLRPCVCRSSALGEGRVKRRGQREANDQDAGALQEVAAA